MGEKEEVERQKRFFYGVCPKRSRKKQKGIDRISELPDSILSYILSFIPTRTAVATCVLSKRWSNVWTSITNLDIQYDASLPYGDEPQEEVDSFEAFVRRVLAVRENSPIKIFRLSAKIKLDPSVLEDCIRYAVCHGVQELKIQASCSPSLEIKPEFLSCQSLRVLQLSCSNPASMVLPRTTIGFPALTTLHLKRFVFSEKKYSAEMISCCPCLETLVLSKCSIRPGEELQALIVSAPQLRNLEILNWRSPWDHFEEQAIFVYAPKLTSFKCEGHIPPVSFKGSLPCLDSVCLDLCYPLRRRTVNRKARKRQMAEYLIGMLEELCSMRSLTWSLKVIQILEAVPDRIRPGSITFENLTSVKIKEVHRYSGMSIDMEKLTRLLRRAPRSGRRRG